MRVFTYELKKIMVSGRGFLYCLIALLIGTILLIVTDVPKSNAMEQHRGDYEWYLEKLDGACTEEKSAFLEQEAQSITEARQTRSKLQDKYYAGQMTREQYNQELSDVNAVLEHENGLNVAYQQYLYICENTNNRYFLQTNGWSGLLDCGLLDFPLFLAVLLLATSAFCSEYSCQMNELLKTSKESRKSARCKVAITICTVLFLCLATAMIRYGFYAIKYGMPHGSYPVQSIGLFASSTKHLSLIKTYIAMTALRCFGYVFLSVLILFFSVLVKRYALTVLLGAVSTLIPYIGLSKTVIVRLPLPLPFMLATDFFMGDTYTIDALTGNTVLSFSEVSPSEAAPLLVLSAVLCAVCAWWVLRQNTNCWQIGKRTLKRYGAAALSILLLLTVSACTAKSSNNVVFNLTSPTITGSHEVKASPDKLHYTVENKDTGAEVDLVLSPLFGIFSGDEAIKGIYMEYPYVYYVRSKTEQIVDRIGNYNSTSTQVSVVKLSLETYQEQVIFEKRTDSGRSLLGIEYTAGDTWMFLQYSYGFFLNEGSLFFVTNDGITEVDRTTGSLTCLDIPTNGNIAFDGQRIYYINKDLMLTTYHTKSHATSIFENIVAYDFCLTEKGLYYIDRTDFNKVYFCDCAGANAVKVYDAPALSVSYDSKRIAVITKADGQEIYLNIQT